MDRENGVEKAFCCLYAVPRDFAKIGRLLLNNGMVGDEQIVPKDYVEACLKPNPTREVDGKKNTRYGMHFWSGKHNNEPFYHLQGLYGQYVIALPESNLIIVRTGRDRLGKDKTKLPADLYKYIDIAKKM